MACKLTEGNGVFDAFGTKDDEPVVLVKSDAAAGLDVLFATYAGTAVALVGKNKMKLPKLLEGTKELEIVIDGVKVGDDVQLFEECPGAKELSRAVVGAAQGGPDLRIGFRIHV